MPWLNLYTREAEWILGSHSECPKERVLLSDVIREHKQRRFERLTSTGSGHFELSASGFAHMFGPIRRKKVKFLINTYLVALRHIKKEQVSNDLKTTSLNLSFVFLRRRGGCNNEVFDTF